MTYALRGFGYPLFAYSFLVWITYCTPTEKLGRAVGLFWFVFTGGLNVLGAYYSSWAIIHFGNIGTLWTSLFWSSLGALFALGMRRKYPDIVLFPEWGTPSESCKAGFPIDFIFQTGKSGYQELFYNIKMKSRAMEDCYFDLNGKGNSKKFSDFFINQLDSVRNSGYICVPTTNHG